MPATFRASAGAWPEKARKRCRRGASHFASHFAIPQIGNFADFCNDCGNCDVFCPEDGGPYLIKPRFFGSLEAWVADRPRDGFFVTAGESRLRVHGRFAGRDYTLEIDGTDVRYEGSGFRLTFAESDPIATLAGEAAEEVDLTYFRLMALVGRALLFPAAPNYVNCLPA